MAVSVKVHRVANPGRRRRTRKRNARVRVGRNRLGRFVKTRTKRKRVARVTRRRVNRRRKARATNPVRRRRRTIRRVTRRRVARKVVRNRKRKRNHPLLIELGAINPRRERRKRVAKRRTRRTANTRRRRVSRRRRSNPVVNHRRRRRSSRVTNRRRRSNGRRHYSRRRRNPMGMTSGDMLTSVIGGLIGMAATKFLPTLVPASLTAGSPFMSVIVTGVGAFAAGMIADKVAPKYGKAVLVGGLIQTGSAAMNTFAPSLAASLGVSGVGDIIPTQPFPVPNNQMRPVMVMPSGGSGMGMIGAGIKRRAR